MLLLLMQNLQMRWGSGSAPPASGANKTPASPRVAGALKARG